MEQRKLGRTGLSVSVLGLGTVELGMKYGLGVETPPPKAEAIALLQHVVEKGITYFDTARSYGIAEELIGESGIADKPGVVIGTKCGAFYEKGEDPRGDELRQRITDDVNASLQALRRNTLDLLQVHGPSAEVIERGELLTVLGELKAQGKVRNIGIATRGEDAPRAAIRSRKVQTIQVGFNILDQRMHDRVIPEASRADVGIIARSVFLKGVLTPRRQFLPRDLNILRARANAIEEYALRHGMELEEAAVRFVLSVSEVSALLIGTTKKEHIDAACDRIERGVLPSPIMNELSAFRIDDEKLVDPKQWKL
ncbi:MAG: oxidoreductase, aryl-alcohol dehydrogenase-like [Parcubacteria group bacterium Gr01-1014_106]|nr:MAG: oxidoreductase, aryl-alcohol dehydrogenase-like [Parcubacteria group bacterium Gr01-1014_106]